MSPVFTGDDPPYPKTERPDSSARPPVVRAMGEGVYAVYLA